MPFIAAKSLILVRNTPARTTSSKLLPAALRTAERFWRTRSVSATIPPSTTLPVAGSWATCPLKKRKPSILTAWENGPTGGASSGEVIAVLLMANSCGYRVRWSGRRARGGARFQCLVGVCSILERKALIDVNAHLSRGHHLEQLVRGSFERIASLYVVEGMGASETANPSATAERAQWDRWDRRLART